MALTGKELQDLASMLSEGSLTPALAQHESGMLHHVLLIVPCDPETGSGSAALASDLADHDEVADVLEHFARRLRERETRGAH